MRTRPLVLGTGIVAVLAASGLGASAATAAGAPTDTRTSITVDCAVGEGSNDNHMLLPDDVLTITLLNCEDWEVYDTNGFDSMTTSYAGVTNTDYFIVPSDTPTLVITVDTANMNGGEADIEMYNAIDDDYIDIDIVEAAPATVPTGSLLSTTRITMPVEIDTFSFALDMVDGPDNDELLGGDADCELEVGYHPYRTLPITITAEGEFTFRVIDVTPVDEDVQWGQPYFPSQDFFLAVYENFDASNPEAGLVTCTDDRNEDDIFVINGGTTYLSDDQTPEFISTLEPGDYTLVLTTYRTSSSTEWAAGQFSPWSGVSENTWEPQPMTALFELWGPADSLIVGGDTEEPEPELADTGANDLLGAIGLGALVVALIGGGILAARRQRA